METITDGLGGWIWDAVSPISVGLQALTSECRLAGPRKVDEMGVESPGLGPKRVLF